MSAHYVVKLTELGAAERVLDGKPGMTFVVDAFAADILNKTVHVRDYRYAGSHKPYQVWTLSERHYTMVRE